MPKLMNTHKYKIGDKVSMTNCYGTVNLYVILKLVRNDLLEANYYTIAIPLRSGKLPKRSFASLVRESDLSLV